VPQRHTTDSFGGRYAYIVNTQYTVKNIRVLQTPMDRATLPHAKKSQYHTARQVKSPGSQRAASDI